MFRKAAIRCIPTLVKMLPEVSNDAFEMSLGLEDHHVSVQTEANARIVGFVEMKEEKTSDVLELLFSKMKDEEWAMREAAVLDISKVVKHLPQKASKAFSILSSMCQDIDFHVRRAAIKAFLKLLKTFLKRQPRFSTFCFQNSKTTKRMYLA